MSTASERLKQARLAAGYHTAAEAAKTLGMAYPTYAAHENGSRGKEGYGGYIDKYAQKFHVRGEWLRTGKGQMKPGKKPEYQELFETLPPEKQSDVIRYMKFVKAA